MARKEFLKFPMLARQEILRLQTDLGLHRKAVEDFCEYYRALKRMRGEPNERQTAHWTVLQLLDLT